MFKFRHFHHFLFYNPKKISIPSISNPLIDYTWSTQVTSGNMELIDSGDTPTYNAVMYSGEGILTDSTHYLDLTDLVTGATSMIFYKDGVATYTETLFYLFNNGTYKDLYYFSDSLTTAEQNKYSTDPNGFFDDVRNGTITDCVFNSPFDGTDEYIKDYQNYSLGNEEVINGTFDTDTDWIKGTGWTIANGKANYDGTGGTSNIHQSLSLTNGNTYIVSLDVILNQGSGTNIIDIGGDRVNAIHLPIGHYDYIYTTTDVGNIFIYGRDSEIFEIDNISIKQISGQYEITGYDGTVRQNNLSYGTQEMKFLRDGNWRGIFSQYIELSIGHADTRWTPSGTWQIEEVDVIGTTETHRVYNSDGTKYTNGVADGTYTVPTTEIILNSTNIENITIDEYKIFRVYPTINDEATLYNNYANPQPTTQTIQLDGTMTGEQ